MRCGLLFSLLLLLPGCASYYSHYAMFPAENSAGEPRQVRLSWDTADYPSWWLTSDKATPIRLETQCSDRVWRLRDSTQAEAGPCGEGIRACGRPGHDMRAPQGEPATASDRCLAVSPSEPGSTITGVGSKLKLLVSCQPVSPTRGKGDEQRNVDYIRASAVPYTVYVRRAPRGSFRARVPEFDRSVCDAE